MSKLAMVMVTICAGTSPAVLFKFDILRRYVEDPFAVVGTICVDGADWILEPAIEMLRLV